MAETKKTSISKHVSLLWLRLEIGLLFLILLATAGHRAKPWSGKSRWFLCEVLGIFRRSTSTLSSKENIVSWLRAWNLQSNLGVHLLLLFFLALQLF